MSDIRQAQDLSILMSAPNAQALGRRIFGREAIGWEALCHGVEHEAATYKNGVLEDIWSAKLVPSPPPVPWPISEISLSHGLRIGSKLKE